MLSGENKAGILVTVIVHLTVIIFLLAASIHTIAHRGNEMILLDFDDYEELVAKEKEPELQEEEISPEEMAAIQASIEQMLAERNLQHAEYHNITTSRNVDARNTDADQLYEDAAKLAEALRSGQSVSYDDEGDLAPSRPGLLRCIRPELVPQRAPGPEPPRPRLQMLWRRHGHRHHQGQPGRPGRRRHRGSVDFFQRPLPEKMGRFLCENSPFLGIHDCRQSADRRHHLSVYCAIGGASMAFFSTSSISR